MAFNLGFPLVGMQAPAVSGSFGQPARRSWQERLFDRFAPDSDIEGKDKKALVRQGLLQLAAGLQSSPNFGQALTQGLLAGSQALNQGVDDIQARRLREQQMLNLQATGLPTEYRSRDLMAKAAGYQPGTPEYQKFFRVAGGIDARAMSGARKNVEIVGRDGIKRPGVFDPSSPYGYSVYDESVGGFRPLDAGEMPTQDAAAPAPQPMGGAQAPTGGVFSDMGASIAQDVERQIGRPLTPQERAQIGDGSQPFNLQFQAPSASQAPPIATPRQMPVRTAAPAGLAVGRSPEEQAALTTSAEENAKLAVLPRRLELEAQGEAMKTTAKGEAQTAVDVRTKQLQKVRDAQTALALLDEAEGIIPSATGSGLGSRADVAAGFFGQTTAGAEATDQLKIIAERLTQQVPRFEGPQSDKDTESYRRAAGDLANDKIPRARRLKALETLRDLNLKAVQYQGAPPPVTPRAAPKPATKPAQQGWGIRRVP